MSTSKKLLIVSVEVTRADTEYYLGQELTDAEWDSMANFMTDEIDANAYNKVQSPDWLQNTLEWVREA
jgi:hypothetical protein